MTTATWNRLGWGLPLVAILTAFGVLAVSRGKTLTTVSATNAVSADSAHGLGSSRLALYAGIGADLTQYDVDVENATLIKRGSVTLPGNVQYAWPHPSRQYFYVAWSTGGPPTAGLSSSGGRHGVTAFRIDPMGALHPHGQPAVLPSRPIHLTTDIPGTHLLIAYNDPSGVTVYRISPDGTIASQVPQPAGLDVGIYAHQVRVDPSNKTVILVTRGNGPSGNKPEDPGALKIFSYTDGLLMNRASIAPEGGFNFQPRNLDFHPLHPWVFVSLERQNKLQVYEKLKGGTLSPDPMFIKDTTANTGYARLGQLAGPIHIHPNGRFVYQLVVTARGVANRTSGIAGNQGKSVVGGENVVAVFAIDQNTAEPTLIQNIDTRGLVPRAFDLDPTGRILIVANQLPSMAVGGTNVSTMPPNLAVFRVRGDGKLDFVRKYDVQTDGSESLFWMGLVPLH